MPLLDAIDPAAKTIGAVNTIVATPKPSNTSTDANPNPKDANAKTP